MKTKNWSTKSPECNWVAVYNIVLRVFSWFTIFLDVDSQHWHTYIYKIYMDTFRIARTHAVCCIRVKFKLIETCRVDKSACSSFFLRVVHRCNLPATAGSGMGASLTRRHPYDTVVHWFSMFLSMFFSMFLSMFCSLNLQPRKNGALACTEQTATI